MDFRCFGSPQIGQMVLCLIQVQHSSVPHPVTKASWYSQRNLRTLYSSLVEYFVYEHQDQDLLSLSHYHALQKVDLHLLCSFWFWYLWAAYWLFLFQELNGLAFDLLSGFDSLQTCNHVDSSAAWSFCLFPWSSPDSIGRPHPIRLLPFAQCHEFSEYTSSFQIIDRSFCSQGLGFSGESSFLSQGVLLRSLIWFLKVPCLFLFAWIFELSSLLIMIHYKASILCSPASTWLILYLTFSPYQSVLHYCQRSLTTAL